MQSKTHMLTAKQIPRPTFNANDPTATREYICRMANSLNCLAMLAINPFRYYSVPEEGLSRLREAKLPQLTPLPEEEQQADQSSSHSDKTPTTTSSQSPKLSTTSSLYPSPQKSPQTSRPESEATAQQLRAL
jgi:hypothetical protein